MGILSKIFSSPIAAAGVGFALGGPIGAGIFGGIAGTSKAGKEAAEAQGQKAILEQQAAAEGLAFQKQTREQAEAAAEPSFEELAAIQNLSVQRDALVADSKRALARQEALLDAVDPALQEAGRQALELLQGKDAAALDPIRNQRTRQREQLEQQLAQRLGSGFRTSSAGIEALGRFDDSTDTLLFDAQQQTLGTFLQFSAAVRPDLIGDITRAGQAVGQLTAQEIAAQQNIAGRKVAAISGTPVSFQNVIATAGAERVGDILQAQNKGQTFGTIANVATQFGLAGIGAAAGGLGVPGGGGGARGFAPAGLQVGTQSSGGGVPRSPAILGAGV